MSTIRSEMFKTCNNAKHENKNTESLGSVFEGLKSLFNEVGSEALDYLFKKWPEDPISTDGHQVYTIDQHILPMKTPARIEIEIEVQKIAANGALRFNFYETKVMSDLNEDNKDRNHKSFVATRNFDSEIQLIVAERSKFLSEHGNETLNPKFDQLASEPRKV